MYSDLNSEKQPSSTTESRGVIRTSAGETLLLVEILLSHFLFSSLLSREEERGEGFAADG